MKYDLKKLREDLSIYFGAAVGNPPWVNTTKITESQQIDDEKLIIMAKENNFDLKKYKKGWHNKYMVL